MPLLPRRLLAPRILLPLLLLLSLSLYLLLSHSRIAPDSSNPHSHFRPFGIGLTASLFRDSSLHDLLGPPDPSDPSDSDPLSPPLPLDLAPGVFKNGKPKKPSLPLPQTNISNPLLAPRLSTLLSRPVLPPSTALSQNARACPPRIHDALVNPDQHRGQREWWNAVDEAEVVRRRDGMVKWLEGLEKAGVDVVAPELGYGEQKRGIVMTAGNQDTVSRALVTIRLLRRTYSCHLPIELFSFPGEIQDHTLLGHLEMLDVRVRELKGQSKVSGAWKNFHIKALAILLSSFDEVLYLDSDNLPLRDPTYLFEEPLFQQRGHGAVFWPDINKDHPENPIWRLLGRTCDPTEWELDSGQLLISKSGNRGLNLAALHLATHMQAEHEFWFRLSGGDKDTFRYAFWALGLEYATAPRWVASLGYEQEGKFCGLSMVQFDLSSPPGELPSTPPSPLFIHANLLKHAPSIPPSRALSVLKHATPDGPSLPALDRARWTVYTPPLGGMCLDLAIAPPLEKALVDAMEEGDEDVDAVEGGEGRVEVRTQRWEEVEGGLYKGFAAEWESKGGRVGGW